MRKKSVLALWHWGQSLQRKVTLHFSCWSRSVSISLHTYCVQALVCWLMYAMNRKRKAERYAAALRRHRSRLLLIGVTQWIEVDQPRAVCKDDGSYFASLLLVCKLGEQTRHCSTKHRYTASLDP